MKYRRNTAYVLAIHGSPVWPSCGLDEADIPSDFVNHINDGGQIKNLLSTPSVTQSIDIYGGFSSLSDCTFEFIDNDDFTKFFGANRVTGNHTYLTSPLSMTDTAVVCNDTSIFSDGDLCFLPRETVSIGAVDTETEMAIETRSLFSAFVEGRSATRYGVSVGRGVDIFKSGHANHSGRWVCLYRLSSGPLGTWGAAERVYAGVVESVTIQGRKVSLSTKSVTSLLSQNIGNKFSGKLADEGSRYIHETLYLENKENISFTYLTAGITYTDLRQSLTDKAVEISNTSGDKFQFDLWPTIAKVYQGSGSAPNDGDTVSLSTSSKALVDFLDIAETATAITYHGTGFLLSKSDVETDLNKYQYIIHPGARFNFAQDENSQAAPNYGTQYFKFQQGEKAVVCKCLYDDVNGYWYVTSSAATPWYDGEGNSLPTASRYLPINYETCVVESVITTASITTGILYFLNQCLISTGESIAPSEDGDLSWYHSLAIPYHLVNSDSFGYIAYTVKPFIQDEISFQDYFENALKIAGLALVWQNGQLSIKTNSLASGNNATVTFDSSNITTEKPSVIYGYQAPLTSIKIKFSKLGIENNYYMNDPQSTTGNSLDLTDEQGTTYFPNSANVAYALLYYLSTIVPTVTLTIDDLGGATVGDVVEIDNAYIPDSEGYGVTERTGVVVETSQGAETQIRVMLSGNIDLSSFGALAPAALVDTTQGILGIDNDSLYLTNDFNRDEDFTNFLYRRLGTQGPLSLMARTTTAFTIINNCYLDISHKYIILPSGYDWPAMFQSAYRDTYIYITCPSYFLS
jgi:hypothetical protein